MSKHDASDPVPAGPGGDGRAGALAAAGPAPGAARRAALGRLLPWAVLVISVAAGWGGSYALLRPVLGRPALFKAPPAAVGLRAEASVAGPAEVDPISDEQAVITWRVINSGDAPWAVDLYRFDPETSGALVIHLPATIEPGKSATVRAVVSRQPGAGDWAPAWNLYGPKGKVAGGRLTAPVPRRPDSSAGE